MACCYFIVQVCVHLHLTLLHPQIYTGSLHSYTRAQIQIESTWPAARGVRGIFFSRGKVAFPDFSKSKMLFFPVELSISVDPKQVSVVSKSERSSAHFRTFSPSNLLHFSPSLPIFLLFLSILLFPSPFFSRLVSKNFLVKNVWRASGGIVHPLPPVTPLPCCWSISAWCIHAGRCFCTFVHTTLPSPPAPLYQLLDGQCYELMLMCHHVIQFAVSIVFWNWEIHCAWNVRSVNQSFPT